MTVTDTMLINVASAIAEETYIVPGYLAVGTEVVAIATTDTALAGEIGTRKALTTTRALNELQYSAIRSGVNVIDTVNGDDIASIGLISGITSGPLLIGVAVSGILQTTAFDIESITDLEVTRK